jgi:hypothetical protein
MLGITMVVFLFGWCEVPGDLFFFVLPIFFFLFGNDVGVVEEQPCTIDDSSIGFVELFDNSADILIPNSFDFPRYFTLLMELQHSQKNLLFAFEKLQPVEVELLKFEGDQLTVTSHCELGQGEPMGELQHPKEIIVVEVYEQLRAEGLLELREL